MEMRKQERFFLVVSCVSEVVIALRSRVTLA